jgi:acyl-coenzyme A synthetase/AMP-(fatty) acid ligase
MIHDGRFDPAQRLDLLRRERVAALCQAPTEYRVMAARTDIPELPDLQSMVAAGEALDATVIAKFEDATGVRIRDGYGQTETGHLAEVQPGVDCPAGSMGRPLPGIEAWIEDGELVVEASTIPTLFLRTLDGEEAPASGPWRTGDLVREEDGFLFFEGRNDDIISSAGYRIGPFEVESALSTHPAVAECAAVAAPDVERGSVVRAVVVLKPDFSSSPELAAELQEHVKAVTAPYKYPRIVDFVDSLPKTTTGKVRRAELRGEA